MEKSCWTEHFDHAHGWTWASSSWGRAYLAHVSSCHVVSRGPSVSEISHETWFFNRKGNWERRLLNEQHFRNLQQPGTGLTEKKWWWYITRHSRNIWCNHGDIVFSHMMEKSRLLSLPHICLGESVWCWAIRPMGAGSSSSLSIFIIDWKYLTSPIQACFDGPHRFIFGVGSWRDARLIESGIKLCERWYFSWHQQRRRHSQTRPALEQASGQALIIIECWFWWLEIFMWPVIHGHSGWRQACWPENMPPSLRIAIFQALSFVNENIHFSSIQN